jgi:hypothetical protein
MEHNGGYLMAWGRIAQLPDHVMGPLKSKRSALFIDWCDREVAPYQ